MKALVFNKNEYAYYIEKHLDKLKEKNIDLIYVDLKDFQGFEEECIAISGVIDKQTLEAIPNLKMIIVPYTGLNGLPLEKLEELGVKVLNTSAHGIFVAERALTLMLAISCSLISLHNKMVKGFWSCRNNSKMRKDWASIRGKKVAIYGYGVIGKEFVKLIEPFGCHIGILNYKNREFKGIENKDNLLELAKWCDYMVVCAPLNEKTKGSIDKVVLSEMNKKILINVGRGSIANEEDLYNYLKGKQLGGLASDVWFNYPKGEDSFSFPSVYPIHELDNVIMTPHNAGFEKLQKV